MSKNLQVPEGTNLQVPDLSYISVTHYLHKLLLLIIYVVFPLLKLIFPSIQLSVTMFISLVSPFDCDNLSLSPFCNFEYFSLSHLIVTTIITLFTGKV